MFDRRRLRAARDALDERWWKLATDGELDEIERSNFEPAFQTQVRRRIRRRAALGFANVDCLRKEPSAIRGGFPKLVHAAIGAASLSFLGDCRCLTRALDELPDEMDVQRIRLRARALHKPRRLEKPEGGGTRPKAQTQPKPSADLVHVEGPIVVAYDEPKPAEETLRHRVLPRANAAQRSQVPEAFRWRSEKTRRSDGFLPPGWFEKLW